MADQPYALPPAMLVPMQTLRKPDVVVIGAGVVGCSVAWHLAALGARNVLVLERG